MGTQRKPASATESFHALQQGLVAGQGGGDVTDWGPFYDYQPQQEITKQFRQLIYDHRYVGAFEAAITAVSRAGIPNLAGIDTLNRFYKYLDDLVTWTPGIRHWEHNGVTYHERTVYNKIVEFYIYMDQPEIRALQSPIAPRAAHPWEQQDSLQPPPSAPFGALAAMTAAPDEAAPLGRYERAPEPWNDHRGPARQQPPIWHVDGEAELSPLSRWLVAFADAWGDYLDTPESAARIASFSSAPEYQMDDYLVPEGGWKTFNEFFGRELLPGLRPIAGAADPRVIVAPADSTYIGQWEVNEQSGVVVKHIEWQIAELLADSKFGGDFHGGTFTHSFLNTFDYHRQHAPVAGEIVEATVIPGQCYLDVFLQTTGEGDDIANAVVPVRHLSATDATGYQFVQSRGLIVIQSEIGKVAVLPMGMAQVSSVIITRRVGDRVEKGDEISYFQFGGSDIVMVFERQANVAITAAEDTHYNYGKRVAMSHINEFVDVDAALAEIAARNGPLTPTGGVG